MKGPNPANTPGHAQESVNAPISVDDDDPDPAGSQGQYMCSPPPTSAAAAEAAAATAADPLPKVSLKLQCASGAKRFRIGVREPLSRLFEGFREWAAAQGWCSEGAAPAFWFDGDKLGGGQTCEELGCEDDDVIEVHGL